MSAAQPARGVAADLAAWVHDAGRAVGESTRGGRVLHGPDGEVETVVDYQAGEATGAVQSSPRGRCGRGLGCLRIAAVSLLSLLHAAWSGARARA